MVEVMIDIETLGRRPGAVVWALAAVRWEGAELPAGEALDTFYALIDPRDAERRGLKVDAETSLWWLRQGEAARAEMGRAVLDGKPLADVLDVFANWFVLADPGKVWCKGASFDFPMLTAAHEAVGKALPWHFGRECCYRTMARLCPEIAAPRPAVAHHALHDARAQAEHLLAIRRRIGHNG